MKKILILLIFIILTFFIGSKLSVIFKFKEKEKASLPVTKTDKKAVDFSAVDIYGNNFHLYDKRGEVILLDFWSSWCDFCRESIPYLIELHNNYKDKGLVIVGIALDFDKDLIRRIAEDEKIPYAVIMGNASLADRYAVYAVPTRFLINRQGEIIQEFIGFREKEELEEAVRTMIEN